VVTGGASDSKILKQYNGDNHMGHPITKSNPRAYPSEVQGQLKDGRNYLLRSLEPSEETELTKLVEIYRSVYRELGEEWSQENATRLLEDLFSGNDLVAFIEGEIAGAICLGTKYTFEGKAIEGKEFFVSQPEQHSGIGTVLFDAALERAQISEPDAKTFTLITFEGSGHAREYYNKLGFEKDDRLVVMDAKLNVVREGLKTRIGESTRR